MKNTPFENTTTVFFKNWKRELKIRILQICNFFVTDFLLAYVMAVPDLISSI